LAGATVALSIVVSKTIAKLGLWPNLSWPVRASLLAAMGGAMAYFLSIGVHAVAAAVTSTVYQQIGRGGPMGREITTSIWGLANATLPEIGWPAACILFTAFAWSLSLPHYRWFVVSASLLLGPFIYGQYGTVGLRVTGAVAFGVLGGAFLGWLCSSLSEMAGRRQMVGPLCGLLGGAFAGWLDPEVSLVAWASLGALVGACLCDHSEIPRLHSTPRT